MCGAGVASVGGTGPATAHTGRCGEHRHRATVDSLRTAPSRNVDRANRRPGSPVRRPPPGVARATSTDVAAGCGDWDTVNGMGERESLGAKLRRARLRRFVGRSGEVELLRRALHVLSADGDATEPYSFRVLFLHGPGGVGKSTLIDVLAGVAETEGAGVVRIDARLVPPTRDGILDALGDRLGGCHVPPPPQSGRRPDRRVAVAARAARPGSVSRPRRSDQRMDSIRPPG
jgi:hypothetical protein